MAGPGGQYCCVYGCGNNQRETADKSFFRLPSDPEKLAVWLSVIQREDLLETSKSKKLNQRICSDHFGDDHYDCKIIKKLKKNAVPHLNLPGSLFQEEPERGPSTSKHPTLNDVSNQTPSTQTTTDFSTQTKSDEKCKDITEKQFLTVKTSESSGVERPSCSSVADSDMEEDHPEDKSDPSPTTWMAIKQEVLWDGEQSAKESSAAQAEQGAGEAAPPGGERRILEELRRQLGTVARRDEVSSGLEEIRQEIRDLAQGDEFDAFGRYVASLLRNMRPRRASHAQPLLINLLAAEMMKQNDDDLA